MRCIVCHTPIDGMDPHRILPGAESVRDCSACHDVNSPLIRKYLGPDDRRSWVTNPLVFEQAYVPGATRNRVVDGILVSVLALTLIGLVGHGLIRIATAGRRKAAPFVVEKTYLHRLGVRVGHWLNATLILLLLLTGMRIHFGGKLAPVLSFETAFNIHNLAGAAFVVVVAFFFLYNLVTRDWRQYLVQHPAGTKGMVKQARWYLGGIFRGAPHPYHVSAERKFNPLQRVAYALVMYMAVPLIVITGLILFWPGILPDRMLGRPGGWWIATAHYLLAWAVLLFLVGHLYLITTGDRLGYLLSSMFTGWYKHHRPKDDGGSD